ncbi:MAG TPA: pyridoxal 5'-phosphate synthase glutaminase subunit PdxT [Candidatus Tectomicrobia bacterium]|nr:pyridoxal 5'-phosphate synthase glutaminase subunit PdxT [Candidatus Tectomicrobia bacterium]
MRRVGVLAIQGDFAAHAAALRGAGVEVCEVRKADELREVDGLVIPGGESTTLLKFILNPDLGLIEAFQEFHRGGKPLFGTCAGLILVAKDVTNPAQFSFGFIDVGVARNAYGRQKESFETVGESYLEGSAKPLKMVFIRAPRMTRLGPQVDLLATWHGEPVMARQGHILVASFHPELSGDLTVHRYFLEMVKG